MFSYAFVATLPNKAKSKRVHVEHFGAFFTLVRF